MNIPIVLICLSVKDFLLKHGEKLELSINESKKTKTENSESANRSSPIIAKSPLANQNCEVDDELIKAVLNSSQEIKEEASGSQCEDEDTEENRKYIDVLKKYFGYKSFRPYANLNGYTLHSWLI